MRCLLLISLCLLLAGCEYTVPLVQNPGMQMDSDLIGLWERTESASSRHQALVLPFDDTHYVFSYRTDPKEGAMAKASLVECADMTLVQIEWMGSVKGKLPENDRIYQYASYTLEGDTLRVALLNSAVVPKDVMSSAELRDTIEARQDHPDLFRPPMVFRRISD